MNARGDMRTEGTSKAEDAFHLSYQGWSGCIVRAPRGSGAATLVFDPSPEGAFEPAEATLLLTHGHPEHVGGALAHLRRTERAPVTVIASTHLCRYLERRTARHDDRFAPVGAGALVEANGWSVRVFEWEHMTLLPAGAGPAARYLLALAKHPRGFAGIVLGGVKGPRHGPMLGFSVRARGWNGSLVYYGEGLHRRTSRQELRGALGDEPIDTLVFGAEPEDAHALPELLGRHAVGKMLAFEPHRRWRAEFGLSQLDIAELTAKLRAEGLDAHPLAAGETVTLRSV